MADFSLILDASKMDAFLSGLGKRLPNAMDLVLKRIGFEAQNRITARTPVDTGRAHAGWMGEHDRRNDDYATFTITNNVPYVIFLEYGHSRQAPSGMVRITMQEIHSRLSLSKVAAMAIDGAARDAGAR